VLVDFEKSCAQRNIHYRPATSQFGACFFFYEHPMFMRLYYTGMRRAEMGQIRHGKGGKDRDVPFSPNLLDLSWAGHQFDLK
jgi:hypothetical protein